MVLVPIAQPGARWVALVSVAIALAAGCSSKPSEGSSTSGEDTAEVAAGAGDRAPWSALVPLPMGKDDLSGYAYSRGPGRAAFISVIASEKSADWQAVESGSRATLLADAGHLEAHWSLALALARQQRYAEVAGPLSSSVAGDWMRWGERSLEDDALGGFLASDYGDQWRDLVARYRDKFRISVARGLSVVGRRGRQWSPTEPGNQSINHRSEIYSYDVESGRYLRLSRTNASVAGFLRAPSGTRLAFVMYSKIWLPGPDDGDARAHIRVAQVGTIDLVTGTMSKHELVFRDVASLSVVFGPVSGGGERLYVRVRNASPERGIPVEQTFLVDTERDTKVEVSAEQALALTGPALTVEHGFVHSSGHVVEGVLADWDDEGAAGAFRLEDTTKTITLPAGQSADATSMQWSPSRTRLVVPTMAIDPCSKVADERSVTLYVVDAAAAKLRAIAVGEGMFAPVWLDDRKLAWVDMSARYPAVRLVDVLSGSEIVRLEAVGGVSTDRLMPETSCRPFAVDDTDEIGSDDDYDNPEPAPAKEQSPETAVELTEPAKSVTISIDAGQ